MQNMVKGIEMQSNYPFPSPMERLFGCDLTLATNSNEMVHFKEALPGWERVSLWVLGGADEEGIQPQDCSHIQRGCRLRVYFNIVNVIAIMWQDDKYYPMNHNT